MDRNTQILNRHLRGEPAHEIAAAYGITRARIYQILKDAYESGDYSVSVTLNGVPEEVDREAMALYLRRALMMAGFNTKKRTE